MLRDEQLKSYASLVNHKDSFHIANALTDNEKYPIGDPRILPYLEALLDDKRLELVAGAPFVYGCIAYVAAFILAAEQKEIGIKKAIFVKDVVKPMDEVAILSLGHSVNIAFEGRHSREQVLKVFQALIDGGYVPLHDLEIRVEDMFHEDDMGETNSHA